MRQFQAFLIVIFLLGMAGLGVFQAKVSSEWFGVFNSHQPIRETGDQVEGSAVVEGALSPAELQKHLEKKLPGIQIESVANSPLDDYYEVFYSGQLIYVSKDGRFILNGNLLELADKVIDHSDLAIQQKDKEKAPERKSIIDSLAETDMVVFKAKNEKHHITVFTDVDCAYCRKLHKEVPALNALGVTVRYLAYPRAGIGSSSYNKLVSVWCADNRTEAMNQAKLHRHFSMKTCDNPVADQYNLTRRFNLTGTPAIILENGELIPGYMPHNELINRLDAAAEASPAAR